jgi:hypothetical protein
VAAWERRTWPVKTAERGREPRLIEPSLSVYAADGVKIGTVAHLHQPVGVGIGADIARHTVVEIRPDRSPKSGPLYVPFTAVSNLTEDGVVLDLTSDAVDLDTAWRTRPTHLPDADVADRSWGRTRPDDWYRLGK